MKCIAGVSLSMVFLALTACGRLTDPTPASDPNTDTDTDVDVDVDVDPPPPSDPWTLHCAACHRGDGAGGPVAPQIQSPVVDYATFVVRQGHAVMDFPGVMPAFSVEVLGDDDLHEILTFLRAAPQPETGAGLYERYCLNCHGVDARSGRADEDVAGEDLEEIFEIVREGHHADDVADRAYMPAWDRTELSDEDVVLIAAYVQSLRGGGDGGGGDDDDDDDDEDDED